VGAGTPDGTLTFTATVRTDSPEQSTDNNTLQATTTYQAQGFISGRVWSDQDRDRQRDADEPPVGNGDDATDSDVVLAARAYDGVTAESAVVEVVDGQHTVVDVGLVPAPS
jgi:hypothetical protein